jgi:hypothetical protein
VNSAKLPHAHEVGCRQQGPAHCGTVPDQVDSVRLNLTRIIWMLHVLEYFQEKKTINGF